MGQKTGKVTPRDIKELEKNTGYTDEEIMHWYRDFMKSYPNGRVTRKQFQKQYAANYPDGDASAFADHVFRTFDKDNDGAIDFREFMCAINLTTRSTAEQQIEWAFDMYDLNGDGTIDPEEMVQMMRAVYKTFGSEKAKFPPDESTPEKRAMKIFQQLDTNKDGKLTRQEFCEGVKAHPDIRRLVFGDPASGPKLFRNRSP